LISIAADVTPNPGKCINAKNAANVRHSDIHFVALEIERGETKKGWVAKDQDAIL
jgi:hypothetical protein